MSSTEGSTAAPANTPTVELTPELQERIRRNRERALQIQAERKRKSQEQEDNAYKNRDPHQQQGHRQNLVERNEDGQSEKKQKQEIDMKEGEVVDCEDWEIGLSEWVSKKEAVAKYCLPEGTLAVCEVVSTKDNPHHKGWAPMKLYRRSELRERAYRRHGGKEGLVKERTNREQKRLARDWKEAEKVFA